MTKGAKIAISLPEELLRSVEEGCRARGESRSQFFRRAAEEYLRRERERELEAQYVRAYRENPETTEELGWVVAASQAVLAEYPWSDEAEG
jgi:metal-responsive CopG/Arc/MetJ family transcriptional regulator